MRFVGFLKRWDLDKALPPFILLVIIFLYPIFSQNKVLFFGDNFSINTPILSFFFKELRKGKLVSWNPYIFSGLPLIGDQNLGLFYPLNILFAFLRPFKALSWAVILNLLVASLGMFYFLKSLGLKNVFSFFGGLVFVFSDSFLRTINNLPMVAAAAWLGWILLAFKHLLEKKKYSYLLLTSLLLCLQLSAGHVQIQFYTWLLLSGLLFFYPLKSFKTKVKIFLLLFFLTFSLSSFLVFPFLQTSLFSSRRIFLLEELKTRSLSFRMLIQLILPNVFSQAQKGISWGPAWRWMLPATGYAGIIPLILSPLVLLRKNKKAFWQKFFIATTLFFIIMALGPKTPVFKVAYFFIPGFKLLRSPTNILLLYSFSLSCLAAFSFSWIVKRSKYLFKKINVFKNIACFSALIILSLFILSGLISLFFPSVVKLGENNHSRFFSHSSFYTFPRFQAISANIWENLVIFLGISSISFIVFYLWLSKKISSRFFILLIIFFTVFDLFYYSRSIIFFAPEKPLNQKSEVAEFLKKDKSQFRFLTSSGYLPYTGLISYWENMLFQPPFTQSIVDKQEKENLDILGSRKMLLAPNWGITEKLATINGYGSMINRSYSNFFASDEKNINFNLIKEIEFRDERINFLNVKYLIADKFYPQISQVLDKEAQFNLAYETENAKIYENTKVQARVFFVTDKKELEDAVRISEYKEDRIDLFTENLKQGRLVLSEVFYPGWQAFVNGKKSEIEIYDKSFMAVRLPAGKHEVRFVYRPKFFYLGLVISILSLFISGGLIWLKKEKKFT